jgi:hypothetical protein
MTLYMSIYGGGSSPQALVLGQAGEAILELVAAITSVFKITDEEILEAVVNETDNLAHICELYNYKTAS